ncbi:hypothetical protein V2J09_022040 [Rumex salicifolius]
MAPSTNILSLSLLLLVVFSTAAAAASSTCNSQKFKTPNKSFSTCTDLPDLSASLHWTFSASTSTLSMAFTAAPSKSSGWIAWAINPIEASMAGSQALVAFKSSNGSVSVSTYNLQSYSKIIQGPISYNVSGIAGEADADSLTIFGDWKLPANTASIYQVWQVGPSVSDGRPDKHDFLPANLNSKGKLDLTEMVAGSPEEAPSPASGTNGGGGVMRVGVWLGFVIAVFVFLIIKSFIWGSRDGRRRPHLVSWYTVCLSRSRGGLGIRKSVDVNLTITGKLGWRLLSKSAGVWGDLISAKYGLQLVNGRIIQSKLCSDSSYVWRSILWALENGVYKGLEWSISDGRSVRFWEDSWLEGGPLIHAVSCSVDASILNRPVKDFWDVGSEWKWNIISNFLPAVTLMRLCAIVVQPGVAPPDSLTWSFSKDGMYTVSSAYVGLTDFNRGQSDVGDIFRVLWRIKVLERIRMFLWLGVHGRLMTNAVRFRRHLTSDPRCAVCSDGEETLLHLFRDCRKAKCVWNSFGPRWQEDNGEFFSLPARSWLFSGLRGEFCLVTGGSNDVIFAVTLGWVWRSRNKCVFGEGDTSIDAHFLVSQAKEFDSVLRQGGSNPLMKMEKHISWAKPEEGWYKVNTDGAKESSMGVATAGGVIRDDSGVWLGGFVKNIGVCSVVAAELWGLYHGLELAWDLGYRKVVLESDSAVAIGMLTRQISDHHPLASLARSCQSFFSRDWIIRSRHIYREANRVADHLASIAFDFPSGLHLLSNSVISASPFLLDDIRGVALPRFVRP